eukprot:1182891-Prorocentrum_minimum.AAC.1
MNWTSSIRHRPFFGHSVLNIRLDHSIGPFNFEHSILNIRLDHSIGHRPSFGHSILNIRLDHSIGPFNWTLSGMGVWRRQGCNHMTCKLCGYHYCWICLGDWATHGDNFYSCHNDGDQVIEYVLREQERKLTDDFYDPQLETRSTFGTKHTPNRLAWTSHFFLTLTCRGDTQIRSASSTGRDV